MNFIIPQSQFYPVTNIRYYLWTLPFYQCNKNTKSNIGRVVNAWHRSVHLIVNVRIRRIGIIEVSLAGDRQRHHAVWISIVMTGDIVLLVD